MENAIYRKGFFVFLFFVLALSFSGVAQNEVWRALVGSAYLDNRCHSVLQRICDEAGARMMGNIQNERAVSILKEELEREGIPVRLETFSAIAWFPGKATLIVKSPFRKELKAFASTQCGSFPRFEADLIYAGYGFTEDYDGLDVKGKLVLVTAEAPPDGRRLLNMEAIEIAKTHGAAGIIIHHKFPGTMAFSTSGNYNGVPLEIPAFNIPWEEGKWLLRLLEGGILVRLEAETTSYLQEVKSSNVVVTIPGKVREKYVLGCHFDSAERGQGAFDNGSGSAVAFEVARLINTYCKSNYYSIEIVWCNGEETGLWGSKKYMEQHRNDPIRAMINMDMIASPSGFNTSGFSEFKPALEKIARNLNGFNLTDGVTETMGTNSDHVSFYREGIPVLNITSKRTDPVYIHYHELGDTFDKVDKKFLSEGAAVAAILMYELANDRSIQTHRRNEEEITTHCARYGVIDILKREKEWLYH